MAATNKNVNPRYSKESAERERPGDREGSPATQGHRELGSALHSEDQKEAGLHSPPGDPCETLSYALGGSDLEAYIWR